MVVAVISESVGLGKQSLRISGEEDMKGVTGSGANGVPEHSALYGEQKRSTAPVARIGHLLITKRR